jgi:CRP-like cAMP-binding protein
MANVTEREFEPGNRVLAALPARDLLSLQRHFSAVELVCGAVLIEVNQRLTHVYFLEAGTVAVLASLRHSVIGVAAVGREGVIDAHTLLLGGGTSLGRCQVLVPGSALVMPVSPFQSALHQSPNLRAACEAHSRALIAQMLQAVPCNRLHTVEQRFARWSLTCGDQAEDDTFEIASEGFTQMLGVGEQAWKPVARQLQNDRLIHYRGGAMTVLDRRGLERAACECYRIVRDRVERPLPRAVG